MAAPKKVATVKTPVKKTPAKRTIKKKAEEPELKVFDKEVKEEPKPNPVKIPDNAKYTDWLKAHTKHATAVEKTFDMLLKGKPILTVKVTSGLSRSTKKYKVTGFRPMWNHTWDLEGDLPLLGITYITGPSISHEGIYQWTDWIPSATGLEHVDGKQKITLK